jgi:hypothetical protein
MDTIISAEPLNGVRVDLHHDVVVEAHAEEEEALRTHDSIMQELRATIRRFHMQRSSFSCQRPANLGLVFKDKQNAKEFLVGEVEPVPLDCNDGPLNGDTPLDDDMMEAVAMALAEIKLQMRAECEDAIVGALGPLRERIAMLEGQLSVLTVVLGGGDGNRTLEASETVRKLRVTT